MPSPELKLAVLLALHGMCIGEICQITGEAFDGEQFRIESQLSEIGGKAQARNELKRPRRYRTIPVNDEVKAVIAGRTGRLVGILPSGIRRILPTALAGPTASRPLDRTICAAVGRNGCSTAARN